MTIVPQVTRFCNENSSITAVYRPDVEMDDKGENIARVLDTGDLTIYTDGGSNRYGIVEKDHCIAALQDQYPDETFRDCTGDES